MMFETTRTSGDGAGGEAACFSPFSPFGKSLGKKPNFPVPIGSLGQDQLPGPP